MTKHLSEYTPAELIHLALTAGIVNIGQLTAAQTRKLDSFVKKGWLSKGKGGPFPMLKTVYAHVGFDFEADRRAHVEYAMYLAGIDRENAIARER